MAAAHRDMQAVYNAKYSSLHVRVSNRAALGLYRGKLTYEVFDIEKGYYADGEDAYSMNKYFSLDARPKVLPFEQSDAEKAQKKKENEEKKKLKEGGEDDEEEEETPEEAKKGG